MVEHRRQPAGSPFRALAYLGLFLRAEAFEIALRLEVRLGPLRLRAEGITAVLMGALVTLVFLVLWLP